MTFLAIYEMSLPPALRWAENLTLSLRKTFETAEANTLGAVMTDPDRFSAYLQERDVDLLFIICENERRTLQDFLNACRSLRIPYLFITDTMRKMPVLAESNPPLREVLAPVSMLEEEVHKAEILSSLHRYTGCRITLLQAADFGHKAQRNTDRILTFLASRADDGGTDFVRRLMAQKGSADLHRELADRQRELVPDMLVCTASREYGLDDLIFGPAERQVLRKAQVPVLLLNPRDDLFSLCD